jgi:PAS domain S-box-containing protein
VSARPGFAPLAAWRADLRRLARLRGLRWLAETRALIVLGLVSMVTSALLVAFGLGLPPSPRAVEHASRPSVAEVLAAGSMGALARDDAPAARELLEFALERVPALRSAAILRADGTPYALAGDPAEAGRADAHSSGAERLTVPLFESGRPWGRLELRFEPSPGALAAIAADPRTHALLLVAGLCAIGFWFYLGRMLRMLDPSRAVPDRVRSALDTLAEGLLLIDAKGDVVLANEAFRELLGAQAGALVGRPAGRLGWTDAAGAPLPASSLPWADVLRSGQVLRQRPVSLAGADGERRDFLANCAPVGAGEGAPAAGVLVSLDDVTELQRTEARLREATARAESANRAKSDFLANMSHEIRTPMNAILGFTEMLRRGRVRDAAQARRHLDTVHANGTHLLALINDILDLSKVEAGQLAVERIAFAPHEVLAEVVETLSVRAAEKGVGLRRAVDGPVPASALGDPARLRQVVTNLVGNAIKFTERGEVVVTERWLPAAEGRGARLQVEVADSGVGIAPDKLEAIFEPFVQADSSTARRFGGTGLGLAISRRFARAMGGDVVARSEPGRGSTFTVTIDPGLGADAEMLTPAQALAERAREDGLAHAWRFPPRRLLVVDDSPENRELVALVLQDTGLQVEQADSGEAALAAVARRVPDLVLMDMQMPGMDGFTATRRLRERGVAVPVLAFTAHALRGFEAEIREAGCDGYLTKPIDVEAMLETLAGRLGGTRVAPDPVEAARAAWAGALVVPGGAEARADAPPAPGGATMAGPGGTPAACGDAPARTDDALPRTGDAPADPDDGPLRSRLSGNARFAAIADAFAARLPERILRMRAALDAGDLVALAEDAHWLKGSAGTVGFDVFTVPATRLESAARAGDRAAADGALARVEALGRRVAAGTEAEA